MRGCAVVVLSVLAVAPSAAQEPLVPWMSVAELQSCGLIASALQERRQAIVRSDAPLVARGKAIAAEARAIDAARRSINLRDTKAIAAFNARLSRSATAIRAYNAAMATRRQSLAGLNAQSDVFNIKCAERPYNPADLAQLPAAHRLAMEARAHSVDVPMLPTELAAQPATPAGTAKADTVLLVPPSRPSTEGVPMPPRLAGLTLPELTAAAGKGDADAQFQLAMRLDDGNGVPRDPAAALDLLLKAAAQNHAAAAFNASKMLSDGGDVPVDKPKSLALLRQAAATGLADAEHNLALWYVDESKDADRMKRAIEWMTRAADKGDPESQFVLAGFHQSAQGGLRDAAAAAARLRQSADQGFRPGQLALGRALAKGDGIDRDQVEALKWYRLAAGLTRIDASQGCGRRLMADSTTRSRAAEAATALAAKLSPYEADQAAAAAEAWSGSARANRVGGCARWQ